MSINKGMKKTICITPVDKTMEGWARAVKINNDFRAAGYTKRESFVEIVIEILESYRVDYKKIQQLQNFWAMRDRSPELLWDLQRVLDQIQNKS